MRITLFLTLVFGMQLLAGNTNAQKDKVTLNLHQATMEKVFDEIEKQTDYVFLFSREMIDLGQVKEISVQNKNIMDVLDMFFSNSNINYRIIGNKIILTTKIPPSQKQQDESINITGKVVDETGEAMPGVNVYIKGTSEGTITNIEGVYQLTVPKESVLVFSFIGYIQQEINVVGRTEINITLLPKVSDLEEVVVIGYGAAKKKLITGANLNVKGDEIEKLNTGTAMEALQGIAPGVSVTRNNGAPGAGTKVVIRGLGTIGNSDPLYIVDGVTVGNIDYLSPSDIESIDVLKDAASAAIYGSRAANGVVLVTTKKGKKGSDVQVSYDGYYGIQNIYKYMAPLNASEYMYIMDEGRTNDGLAPNDWETVLKQNSWLNSNYPNELGTQLGEEIWAKLQNGWKGTDWIDEMTKPNAPVQNHSINITGASEDITYAIGVSYFDQTGIIGGDITDAGYKRITTRLNTQMILFKNDQHDILTVGENFTYTNSKNKAVATGNIYWNDLHNALVQSPLMPAYWDKSPDTNGFTPTLDGLSNDQANPLAVMYYRSNYGWDKNNSVTGNAYLTLEPIKDLVFRSTFGINSWFGHGRSWSPTYALGVLYQNAVDGAQQTMYQGIDYTFNNTLTYKLTLNDSRISIMAGNEMLKNVLNMNVGGYMAETNFGKPEYAYLDNVSKTTINAINTWGRDWAAQGGGLLSYMGRASYSYKEKYMLDVTVRADGSSNFAKGHRWGTFPSASLGWNFSEEDFMSNIDLISYGKLRASWGQNGNQSIPNFIYSANISYIDPGYYFGDNKPISSKSSIPANVPNPDVSWETSEQTDIGLDLRLLNSKLTFAFDWYSKITKDWLVVAPILGTAGASAPYINGGDIQNRGVEFSLGWNDQISDFKYGVSIFGTHNSNEVTRIDNAEGRILGSPNVISQGTAYISRVEVGKPIGYFYGYKTDGLLQNQDDVDAYVGPEGNPYFENQRPGDVRFIDQNNDGVIDEADKVMLGDPNPDFQLGLQINLEYKGVYANTTITGKYGMQVMRSYRSYADRFDQNYTTEIFNRWHGEGTSNTIPRLTSGSNWNTNYVSDIYMHDADFTRIGNLTVGYRFDKLLDKVNWMKSASLYVSFNNLYTFTKYEGMDPDISYGGTSWASGVDLGLYPLPRTVMFGFNVTF